MNTHALFCAIFVAALAQAADPAFPQVEISNGIIKAKILLPDAEKGYYRGTRFDWAGQIESLTYQGHNFFGKWFEKYDPNLHDAIMGPVEEFRGDEGALGYAEAQPGGYFVKIGVGILRRPNADKYFFANSYPIMSTGSRVVTPEPDRVSFKHELRADTGYAYEYRKVVKLAHGKPELIIEHALKNTGKRAIDTTVYNHDFYMFDEQPAGPTYRVKFTFAPHIDKDMGDLAAIEGNELVYKRELGANNESAHGDLTGFGASPKDNDIVVENSKAGTGVREIGDHPLSSLYFWSIRSTVCPEAYIRIHVEPGQTFHWSIRYRFYLLPKS